MQTKRLFPVLAALVTLTASCLIPSCKKDTPVDGKTPKEIDLGLDINWASWNIGASASHETGAFFSWGETAPKLSYTWRTYIHCNQETDYYLKITKYGTDSEWSIVDDLMHLEDQDDAAKVILKKGWRMPTEQEIKDLIAACEWEAAQEKGIPGLRGKSKKNGKTIFFPFSGYYSLSSGSDAHLDLSTGFYWSADLVEKGKDTRFAYCLKVTEENKAQRAMNPRQVGCPIRAVKDK